MLSESSIRDVLRPSHGHAAQTLWRGALVLGQDIVQVNDNQWAWICTDCEMALRKEKVPRYSLANDLWIGDVPWELVTLTIPEQLLIARHYPRCYVFKLYPQDGHQLSPDQLQKEMKGNISLFNLNTEDVVKMLQGQLMPNLASMLAITFVGSHSLSKDWLKSTFRVRRRCVYEALVWLKQHNAMYEDICIEEDRLRLLPEDGIPDEVLSLIHQEANGDVALKEEEGYVEDVEERRDDEGHGDVIPLHFLHVEDVDVSQLSSNELLLLALANLGCEDAEREGGYAVRHGRIPVFDLPIPINRFDALAAVFPVLWPYVEGQWNVTGRRRKLSFTVYVRWALQYHDRRFRTHHSFPFLAFGIEQKLKALASAKLQMHRQ